jgi:enoyl-CoA hydratase
VPDTDTWSVPRHTTRTGLAWPHDRLSALDQEGLPEAEAMAIELVYGLRSLRDGALEGAARFAAGEGRHGH